MSGTNDKDWRERMQAALHNSDVARQDAVRSVDLCRAALRRIVLVTNSDPEAECGDAVLDAAQMALEETADSDDLVMRWAGAQLIDFERRRQVAVEGYTADHDDGEDHARGELAQAAAHYAWPNEDDVPSWPVSWSVQSKRGMHTSFRRLILAGALVAAELDRRRRKAFVIVDDSDGATYRLGPPQSLAMRRAYGCAASLLLMVAEQPWYQEFLDRFVREADGKAIAVKADGDSMFELLHAIRMLIERLAELSGGSDE